MSAQLRLALRQKRLVAYLLGGFASNVGTWVQRLAMGWLVYAETGSIAWVGAVAACEVLPSICVQPVGGVLLDRMSRPRALALGNAVAFCQASALALLYFLDLLDIAALVIAAVVLGLLEGINQPARLTVIAEFATGGVLRAAISLNSLSFNLARFVGPLIASLLLTRETAGWAFALNAMSFLPIIVTLLTLRQGPAAQAAGETGGWGRAFLSGLRYVRDHDILRVLLGLAIVVNICCRSLIELLPAISGHWFDNDPVALSTLTASVACGALLGGFWLMTRRDTAAILGSILLMSGANCLFAMGVALAGGSIVAAAAACFGLGLCASGAAVGMQNLVHHTVAGAYLGRVMAVYGLVQRGGAVLGAMLLGLAGDRLGLSLPILAAGCLALTVTLAAWSRAPVLRQRLRVLERAAQSSRDDNIN